MSAPGDEALLAELGARGVLTPLDRHFAAAAVRVAGEARREVELAAALVSRAVGQGHVCLDLARLVGEGALLDEAGEAVAIAWPALAAWQAALADSPVVAVAVAERGGASAVRPLVLDGAGRLYLRRYWEHQRGLAAALRARGAAAVVGVDAAGARRALQRLFPEAAGESCDWQRAAAAVALLRRFCVVSGGPGTGKTFTVVKILALLIEQALACGVPAPRIAMLAPTGKAAARLAQSVRDAAPALPCAAAVRSLLPAAAATVHRALGGSGRSGRFGRDAANPLLADVVLVDEASMIDLALMARLVDAVPPQARLILLGDKDQLASVEAGAVLADICPEGRGGVYSARFAAQVRELSGDSVGVDSDGAAGGIRDCTVQLTRSYRYAADSGIGALARAINDGDGAAVLRVLADAARPEVRLRAPLSAGELPRELCDDIARHFAPLAAAPPEAALAALSSFRVLCALRRGPFGVEGMNQRIEELLRAERRLAAAEFCAGCPIMITRNDYQLALFNGDVGVVGVDIAGKAWVSFAAAAGGTRRVAAAHLPEHETVYAASVHKSQGSEFDEVAVVLPDRQSPLLTRELLYTAVTRARRAVTIYASAESVAATVARRVERASGLRDLLWDAAPPPRHGGQLELPW